MNNSELIPIESKNGVTIYGRIVNPVTKKLGLYEVHSEWSKYDGNVHSEYSVAQARMAALIGVRNN